MLDLALDIFHGGLFEELEVDEITEIIAALAVAFRYAGQARTLLNLMS